MDIDPNRDYPPRKRMRWRDVDITTDTDEPSHSSTGDGSSTVYQQSTRVDQMPSSRPTRNLRNFIFHSFRGYKEAVEMCNAIKLYISALFFPLDGKGVRCKCHGKILSWEICGYKEGNPLIYVSTKSADYICIRPSPGYREYFDFTLRKAFACIEAFKILSRPHGGNPDLSLDELLSLMVHSMSRSQIFSGSAPSKDYIISLGFSIYYELTLLDETAEDNDQIFTDLPVLVALRDKCEARAALSMPPPRSQRVLEE